MIAAAGLYQMYTKTIAADFMKAGFPAPDVEQSIAKSLWEPVYFLYITLTWTKVCSDTISHFRLFN